MEIDEIMKELDADHDRKITFVEFTKMILDYM